MICTKCQIDKNQDSEYYAKSTICKICYKAKVKEYQKTSNKHKTRVRQYQKGPKYTAYKKEYQKSEEYKVKFRPYMSSYMKTSKYRVSRKLYFSNSINARIKRNIGSRIRKALSKNKDKHSLELLGCSIKDYKTYLESFFIEDMSWDNYGKWHIDHILPLSWFELENPLCQEMAFHYSNTKPMWAKDNLRKGNRSISLN